MEGGEREVKNVKSSNTRSRVGCFELVLRVLALSLTLVAAIVVGLAKQTEIVPITIASGLPPLNVPVPAKWHYMSAFVYFVVANAIACAYAALSLIGLVVNRSGKIGMGLVILVLDLLIVALLFSGNGAAAAVGVIGYNGNSHVQWNKVCNVFDKFCQHVGAGVGLSLLGSLAFLVLVVLAAMKLHKKSM